MLAQPDKMERALPDIDPALVADEDRLWAELWSTTSGYSEEQLVQPGYYPDRWSAKDALAHIGTWLAEAGAALEQIRGGTYVPFNAAQVDEMNERFLDAMSDASPADVRTQAAAARSRMLHAWAEAPADDDLSAGWISKSGPDHYREHLPRLKEWLAELNSRPPIT